MFGGQFLGPAARFSQANKTISHRPKFRRSLRLKRNSSPWSGFRIRLKSRLALSLFIISLPRAANIIIVVAADQPIDRNCVIFSQNSTGLQINNNICCRLERAQPGESFAGPVPPTRGCIGHAAGTPIPLAESYPRCFVWEQQIPSFASSSSSFDLQI